MTGPVKTLLILNAVALAILFAATVATSPAGAACYSWRCEGAGAASTAWTPYRAPITNSARQRTGDLYKPAPGRRVQIRDNHRRILGYIESDGTITNTNRQPVGTVEGLAR
jgi:hypothetical protein